MQTIIRLLAGALLIGFALYALKERYPIDSVVVSLLFAFLFITYPRWLRAKFGEIEFEARFLDEEKAELLDDGQEGALDRLRDNIDRKSEDSSETQGSSD